MFSLCKVFHLCHHFSFLSFSQVFYCSQKDVNLSLVMGAKRDLIKKLHFSSFAKCNTLRLLLMTKNRNSFSLTFESFCFFSTVCTPTKGGTLRELSAACLTKERKIGAISLMPPLSNLRFGQFFTDHMVEADWSNETGWEAPKIIPFGNLSIHPGSSALHYGLQVFEGMKCFRGSNDNLLLFRPLLNMKRLLKSAIRMALPSFNENEMLKIIISLIHIDKSFVPSKDGYSVYIRPLIFSTQPTLGVGAPNYAKLSITLSCCGPYFSHGYKPIKLLADTRFSRSFPGGAGDCKVGGNYGATIYPNELACKLGYNQMLWLHKSGEDFELTECGAMNFFLFWINENGEKELVTPPIEANLILPGIMRDCILHLAKSYKQFKVSEYRVYMKRDLIRAFKEGRVIEAFGCGTAAVICSIELLTFQNETFALSVDPEVGVAPLADKLMKDIFDIQYGRKDMKDSDGNSWAMKI